MGWVEREGRFRTNNPQVAVVRSSCDPCRGRKHGSFPVQTLELRSSQLFANAEVSVQAGGQLHLVLHCRSVRSRGPCCRSVSHSFSERCWLLCPLSATDGYGGPRQCR